MTQLPDLGSVRVAVIGLGYVGLPVAVAFGTIRHTVGLDIGRARVSALQDGADTTGELSAEDLAAAKHLRFSSTPSDIADCNVYVIAVPTPIDQNRQPDLAPLLAASRTVGEVISPGDVVIYESTVYPGATEEDCLPVVEEVSGLTLNTDFFAGYSPERINPSDKARPLPSIVKVTSGSNPAAADFVDALYGEIITAGTFQASSIRVAEAAKVFENTQRDVSIALVNELSMIFSHLGIDTTDVLDAAATKWNFNRFTPGLVGGHCIGVDPYYLMHKSIKAGHIPDIIRLSREINDGMSLHAVDRLIKAMIAKGSRIKGGCVLILGVTFKENCPDIRDTKVVDMVPALREYGLTVDLWDPWADADEVQAEYGLELLSEEPVTDSPYDAVILAVAHRDFRDRGAAWFHAYMAEDGVLFDMKSMFAKDQSDLRL